MKDVAKKTLRVKQASTREKMTFADKVRQVVQKIPRGSVLTYREVAIRAGRPKAYRAVGNILNKNFDPTIPCHRVVRSDGLAGGYNRGNAQKKALLIKEGAITRE